MGHDPETFMLEAIAEKLSRPREEPLGETSRS